MAHGGAIQSPWVYDSGGDNLDRHVTITITFDNATRAITGATLHRDANCTYTKIYLGLGVDGTPNSTTHVFNIAGVSGDVSRTPAQMAAVGFNVIEDVIALGNITAGP
jgi:hypothetical protein